MNSELNPLRDLPAARRFQIMNMLSLMWTTIFCMGASAWLYYGELMAFHMLLAAGTLVTGATFETARTRPAVRNATYRDHPAGDGTARYDDVWGA
jgi:hypothetical protein